jgi:hypothetical protein
MNAYLHVLFSHPILLFVMCIYMYVTKITANYLTNQLTTYVEWRPSCEDLCPFMQPKSAVFHPHEFTPGPCLQPGEFSLYHPPCFCI